MRGMSIANIKGSKFHLCPYDYNTILVQVLYSFDSAGKLLNISPILSTGAASSAARFSIHGLLGALGWLLVLCGEYHRGLEAEMNVWCVEPQQLVYFVAQLAREIQKADSARVFAF